MEITDLQRIRLGAGEVLFVRIPHSFPGESVGEMRELFASLFPNNEVVIATDDIDIRAITPEVIDVDGSAPAVEQ